MFVGHFAMGFLGKRLAPETSLASLFFGAVLCDFLWDGLMASGVEHVEIRPGITAVNALDLVEIAWSHSLVTTILWGALFAGAYFWRRGYRRGAWVLFAAVLSHWILDWVSHRPDMPLAPGLAGRYGLGLWNSPVATLIVEGGLWLGAAIVYANCTAPRGRAGTWALWGGVAIFTLLWAAGLNGAPPPSLKAVAIGNLVVFAVLVGWALWIERLRTAR